MCVRGVRFWYRILSPLSSLCTGSACCCSGGSPPSSSGWTCEGRARCLYSSLVSIYTVSMVFVSLWLSLIPRSPAAAVSPMNPSGASVLYLRLTLRSGLAPSAPEECLCMLTCCAELSQLALACLPLLLWARRRHQTRSACHDCLLLGCGYPGVPGGWEVFVSSPPIYIFTWNSFALGVTPEVSPPRGNSGFLTPSKA